MDLNIKLLKSPDGENHLIIITGELIDAEGLREIFRQVEETTQFLFNCKVLVDLENASLRIQPHEIHVLVHGLGCDLRHRKLRLALVSPPDIHTFEQLVLLSESLCSQGLRAAVFDNARQAVNWLINLT
jgi:hypothetical protein